MSALARKVSEFAARLGHIADVLHEGQGLRHAYPMLADVGWAGNGIRLVFLNLKAQLKFSVLLALGAPHDRSWLTSHCAWQ
jgi:hypothetical protein